MIAALLVAALLAQAGPTCAPKTVTIVLKGVIDDTASIDFQARLIALAPGQRVEILFDTPGGDMDQALDMAQRLEAAARGHEIVCTVDGLVASAGFFLLQSCPVRRMTRRSLGLAHEPYVGASDHLTRAHAREIERLVDIWTSQYVAQLAARMRLSEREIARRIRNRDWWMTPDEALAVGAVDVVIPSPNARP